MASAPDFKVLEAAATWYVQLNAAPPSEAERQAWQRWLGENPSHAQAWARVEKLQSQLGHLPADVALPALHDARAKRRAVLKTLAILIAMGAGTWQLAPTERWMAEYRTGKGQRREIRLADGGRLDLNTDSAVDIVYDGNLRLIRLHRGEILVQTAPDPAGRPFVVHTPEGSIRALGTRFDVHSERGTTRVRVLEHAVEVRPLNAPGQSQRLNAGQQLSFDRKQASSATPAASSTGAWSQGMLTVIEWRLADFLSELSRYRPGYLGCADTIADLRLSGAFRLDDTDIILDNLATSLPIKVRYVSRYWVYVEPQV
ncbi:FecR domain-containing protein [Pseudomonas sp. LRF_L74]|uniref:FecR domain-containing protein n=1 Tax=Pseudomonas sp. LRF_L74 TaxID=3369422 RepID=UPI003F62E72E